MTLMKNSQLIKQVIICILGTMLEWYDFALFAAYAHILSLQFFPSKNHTAGLLAVFTAFASGFLMRPIGAIIFGHMGDKYGRKKTLLLSITLMTVATTLLGLLPGYIEIGALSGALLFILRMLQGFAASGEYPGMITLFKEITPERHKNFISSFALFGVTSGMLLGFVVAALFGILFSGEFLYSIGWRIAFLLGIPLGVIGFYLRSSLLETAVFLKIAQSGAALKFPIIKLMKNNLKGVLLTSSIYWPSVVAFYLVYMYLPNFFLKRARNYLI